MVIVVIAEITRDHLSDHDDWAFTLEGKEFESEALRQWWGWGLREGTPADTYLRLAESNNGKIKFKLYDDDGVLYYEGWLIDDDEALVQQFVLSWAMNDSGCTTIKVLKNSQWVQEIG